MTKPRILQQQQQQQQWLSSGVRLYVAAAAGRRRWMGNQADGGIYVAVSAPEAGEAGGGD